MFKLPKRAIFVIESAVDSIFDRAKLRVLGPRYAGLAGHKKIVFGPIKFDSQKSLPGIFANASAEERNMPNVDVLERLLHIAEGYMEAQRSTTKAQVVQAVGSFLHNAWQNGVDTDLPTVLGGALADVWKSTTTNLKRIVDTEATTMRNMGVLEGIVKVNESLGIEDPTVFFVVVRDASLCKECKRLHLLDDEVTPRAWKLSEVGHDYHKRGDANPKIGGLHPHCRCSMVTLMPGYGFDAGGMVQYVGEDHDEFKRQRGQLKKSQMALAGARCAIESLRKGERRAPAR